MVYRFFDKKLPGGGVKSETMLNQQLAEELHKPIIRKFKKRKVHSSFMLILADVQLVSKFNKGISFLLYVIDIFSKYS